jgi:3-keto-disaccharide hydrolase
MLKRLLTAGAAVILAIPLHAATKPGRFPLESAEGLELVHVVPKAVTYQGHKALRFDEEKNYAGEAVALLTGTEFADGTIDVDLAGVPGAGSDAGARGFVGIAFRSTPHAAAFECFYLRPTNGRADDQLRRNHSTQYTSMPDFPWQRLRSETPGVYESYVDLVTGAWTHVRIEVAGAKARLFVNGATQPALIVNELKGATTSGQVGLWIGAGTEAYFRNLQIAAN